MPQRPPVRMPMQPAAQPPAPQPIVYNDEEYITIDDNLDLDSAYAAIENQYGDCGQFQLTRSECVCVVVCVAYYHLTYKYS